MTRIILTFIISFISFALIGQTKIGGESFPESINSDDSKLTLNGGGTRTKLFIAVYAAGLYLEKKNGNADEIINADKPMAVRLHITSGMVNSENMSEAVNEGFDKSTKGNTAPLRARIDAFLDVFKKDPVKTDDIFLIAYAPGEGIKIYKNDVLKSTVEGLDFKKALFGIWLGDSPVSSGLKKGMLGG